MATEDNILKNLPGYEAILKSVLKSQIKILVDQLCDQTGEEAVILTASIKDGSFSNLGSESGKTFLENNEDIKSQFYGFCIHRERLVKRKPEASPLSKLEKASPAGVKRVRHDEPKPVPKPEDKGPHVVILPVPSSQASKLPTQKPSQTAALVQQGSTSQQIGIKPKIIYQQTKPSVQQTTSKKQTATQSQPQSTQKTYYYMRDDSGSGCLMVEASTEDTGNETYEGMLDEEEMMEEVEDDDDPSVTATLDQSTSPSRVSVVTVGGATSTAVAGPAQASAKESSGATLVSQSRPTPPATNPHPIGKTAVMPPRMLAKLEKFKHECEYCGKMYLRTVDYIKHMRSHTGEKPFTCHYCGQRFQLKGGMDTHIRKKHLNEVSAKPEDSSGLTIIYEPSWKR